MITLETLFPVSKETQLPLILMPAKTISDGICKELILTLYNKLISVKYVYSLPPLVAHSLVSSAMLNKSCSAVVHVSLSLLFIHACGNYRSCITVRMNDSKRQRRSLTSATRTMYRVAHKDAREAHKDKRKGHKKSPRMQHDAL